MGPRKNSVESEGTRGDSVARAKTIVEGHIQKKTRAIYDSKIKQLTNWLRATHASQLRTVTENDEAKEEIVLPLTVTILEAFFGFISQHEDGRNKSVPDVTGYQSAITKLYQWRSMQQPTDEIQYTKTFIAGYKRTVAKAREDGEMPLTEGKQPFTFCVYCTLSELAIKDVSDHSVAMFCHMYLVFCWNLMARSCSVGGLNYNHISWKGDALVVTLPRHKGKTHATNLELI